MGTLSKKQFKLIVGIKNRAREVFDEMFLIKPANISIQYPYYLLILYPSGMVCDCIYPSMNEYLFIIHSSILPPNSPNTSIYLTIYLTLFHTVISKILYNASIFVCIAFYYKTYINYPINHLIGLHAKISANTIYR